MCNFRSSTMTQKCHELMWKFAGKKLHTTRADVKVTTEGFAECTSIYFYNLVIFAWLFKHKLRGCFTVELARCTKYPGLTMLDFA